MSKSIYPYPFDSFPSFIERLNDLNIILSPEWEIKFYALKKNISVDNKGYPRIWSKETNSFHLLHRIVSNCPDGLVVDHINRDPSDCRIENLRNIKMSDNFKNKSVQKNSKSGVAGVVQDKYSMLWEAKIEIRGKKIRKKFKCFNEALAYRKQLERTYFGKFRPL